MFNSDFVWLNFDHTFRPGETQDRSFVIDGNPSAAHPKDQRISSEGYILIQAEDVRPLNDEGERSDARISINGKDLPAFDMKTHEGLAIWMDRIPEDFLRQGNNRLRVRAGRHGFRILNIVVHWRERLAVANVAAAE